MKKKVVTIIISLFVMGSLIAAIATANAQKTPFEANVEALSSPDWMDPGTGDCWDSLEFTLNVLYLQCDACKYFYGLPNPLTKDTCNK